MKEVWNSDAKKLVQPDPEGYIRYALGPLRPAPKEGPGWVFAAGELAMPPYDLAQWDISVMNRSLLEQRSYDEMFAPVKLKDGSDLRLDTGTTRQLAAFATLTTFCGRRALAGAAERRARRRAPG